MSLSIDNSFFYWVKRRLNCDLTPKEADFLFLGKKCQNMKCYFINEVFPTATNEEDVP